MKKSEVFNQCLALATRGLSFEEVKEWPDYQRIAAYELFMAADKNPDQK